MELNLAKYGIEKEEELETRLDALLAAETELKEIKPKYTEYTDIAPKIEQYASLEAQLTTTKQEFDTYKQTVKSPVNEFTAYVNNLAASGLDDEQIVQVLPLRSIKPDDLQPAQKVKLELKFKNPGLTDAHIDAMFQNQFSTAEPEDTTDTTAMQVYQQNKLLKDAQLITAANGAGEYLKTFIGKAFTPKQDVIAQENQARIKEAEGIWSVKVPEIVKSVSTIKGSRSFNLPGGKGLVSFEAPYEFTIPEKELAAIAAEIAQVAIRGQVANTQEGIKQVTDYAKDRLTAKNFDLIQEARDVASNNAFMDFLQKEFNVKMPDAGVVRGAGSGNGTGGKEDYANAVFRQQAKRNGV